MTPPKKLSDKRQTDTSPPSANNAIGTTDALDCSRLPLNYPVVPECDQVIGPEAGMIKAPAEPARQLE